MDPARHKAILDELEAVRAAGGQVHAETELGGAPVPSDIYAGEPRYRAEVERIFWRSWIPVARAPEIAAPGTWLRRTIQGADLAITRDANGALHAFHNTCLHRGSAIVSADGCGKRLVCPFHGWTYHLDGRVASLTEPRSYSPDLDPTRLRLGEAAVAERWGWVWVNLKSDPPSLDAFLGPDLLDELSNFRLDEVEYKGSVESERACSWKLVVEIFLEPYHFPFVHKRSVNPVLRHQELVTASWGDHSRMLIPFRDPRLYEPEGVFGRVAAGVGIFIPPALNEVQRASNLVYFVWPSTVVNFMPNHVTVFRVLPLAPERTRVVIDVYGATTTTDEQRPFWEKLTAGYAPLLDEDLDAAAGVQRGLSGPFKPQLTLSHYDRRVRHFRSRLDAWLG